MDIDTNVNEFGEMVISLSTFLVVIKLTDLIVGEYRVSREEVCESAKRSGITINDDDTYEVIDSHIIEKDVYFDMRVIRGGNKK